jgi:putative transposase
VHKRRNVIGHLPEEHKPAVKKKLQNAYAMTEYADAKCALERLHRELMELNPSAARSLEEGREETLTVHRLRVPSPLRRTLASTNVIESAFSIVETVCRNVKRWRAGDHIERWIGSGLLVAERQFRKVQGYREIPSLLNALANTVSKKAVAEKVKVCVAYDGREPLTFNGVPGSVVLAWLRVMKSSSTRLETPSLSNIRNR